MEVKKVRYHWFYYEDEEQVDGLLDCLNPKGMRERKLQENLKKIRELLKLKKPRKKKDTADVEMSEAQEPIDKNGEILEEDGTMQIDSEPKIEGRHLVFETDDYEDALLNSIWFGQKVPTKRRVGNR